MNINNKYCIVSFLDSFEFPLREATRKEVWWEALSAKREGKNVSIVIVDHNADERIIEGIRISFLSPVSFFKKKKTVDEIHYLTGSIIPCLLSIAFIRSKSKLLTLTDGYMFGADKFWMRKVISYVLPFLFDKIRVYSNYQQKMLGYGDVISPHLPKLVIPDIPKSKRPSIFYMGHISKSKGFDTIIIVLQKLLKEHPEYEFVLANNMIEVSPAYMEKVEILIRRFPNQVIIKGIINPVEELKKAWVYIYPFIEARGTMAFPLSLYESLQCGTPFVSCDISANSEFFDPKYLIEPNNANQLQEKIEYFINERKNHKDI